jgi:hypothetical protein
MPSAGLPTHCSQADPSLRFVIRPRNEEPRPLTLAGCLCWLGVGLWLLSDAARARRLGPTAPRLTPAGSRALRLLGGMLVLGAAVPLGRDLGAALAVAALLVLAMTVLSLAVVLFPLRPREYAASLPMALLLAIATGIWG